MDPKCKLLMTAIFDIVAEGWDEDNWGYFLEELEERNGETDWRVVQFLNWLYDTGALDG